jgi:hypothetical protein
MPIVGINMAWLSVPWVLTTFVAAITYILIDETIKSEQLYFSHVINECELFKIDLTENTADVQKLRKMIKVDDPTMSTIIGDMEEWRGWSRKSELFTFACLVAGFVWSFVGPLILK